MALVHPSGTYTKSDTSHGSNIWAHMTLNDIYISPGYGPGYAKLRSIWVGLPYFLPFPWLKINVMMLEHPSETYTKSVATPGRNGWSHMTITIIYLPLTMGPGEAKPVLFGVFALVWYCRHSSRPI